MTSPDPRRTELLRLRAEVADLEARRLLATRTDFAAFCEYVLLDERTGQPIVLDAMHHLWIWLLQYCWARRLIPWIMTPFGSGKSTLMIVGLTLWLLGLDTSLRVMLVSANDELARERLALIRRYIESSARYHEVFPHVRPDPKAVWSTKKLYLERPTQARDASVVALGITSSPIGARVDVMLFDDFCDLRNMILNPKLRETVFKSYSGPFLSRLEKTGMAMSIATRWHADDAFGRITINPEMANRYGFLIQSIRDDLGALECELILGYGSSMPTPSAVPQTDLERLITAWRTGVLPPDVLGELDDDQAATA